MRQNWTTAIGWLGITMLLSLLLPGCATPDNGDAFIIPLLSAPAPVRDWRAYTGCIWPDDQAPPDDAPLAALLGYWSSVQTPPYDAMPKPAPSPIVQQRLLDAVVADPSLLDRGDFVSYLPHTPAATQFLHELYIHLHDKSGHVAERLRDELASRGVLKDDLIRIASSPIDDLFNPPPPGAMDTHIDADLRDRALQKLSAIDPDAAERVLARIASEDRMTDSVDHIRYTLAVRRHDHALAQRLHDRLMSSDPADMSHDDALALLAQPGPEADHLFAALLRAANPAVRWALASDPDRWTPPTCRLLAAAHDPAAFGKIAAMLLAPGEGEYRPSLTEPRQIVRELFDSTVGPGPPLPDAVRQPIMQALLPLLNLSAHPHATTSRIELIDLLITHPMPQAVADLKSLLLDDDPADDPDAAAALIAAGATIEPAVTAQMSRRFFTKGKFHRNDRIGLALAVLDALPPQRVADGLWTYAASDSRDLFRSTIVDASSHAPLDQQIAGFYTRGDAGLLNWKPLDPLQPRPSDQVIGLLARRLAADPAPPAEGASNLVVYLLNWATPAADQLALRLIARGFGDPDTVDEFFSYRDRIARHAAAQLAAMSSAGGPQAVLAAGVRGDADAIRRAVHADDLTLQRAALAVARMIRLPLEIDHVASLMDSPHKQLAAAADLYLVDRDTPAARAAVVAHSGGAYRIFGPSYLLTYPGLHDDLSRLGPDTFSDLVEQHDRIASDAAIQQIIAFVGDPGDATHPAPRLTIYKHHIDLAFVAGDHDYRRRLTDAEADDIRAYIQQHHIDDLPPLSPNVVCDIPLLICLTPHQARVIKYPLPIRAARFTVYGDFVRRLNQLGDAAPLTTRYRAAAHVAGFRTLLVRTGDDQANIWARGDDIRVCVDVRWHRLDHGRLAGPAADPLPPNMTDTFSNARARSPDRSWCVEQLDGHWWWSNLNTNQRHELTAAAPIHHELESRWQRVMYLPARRGVLMNRANDDNDLNDDDWALVTQDGRWQPVTGVFWPLRGLCERGLQPTGRPHEFWAARAETPDDPDRRITHPVTHLGRYNTATFTFNPVLDLPDLAFDTNHMWVDEPAHTVYVAYHGDVIAFDLPAAASGH